MTLIERTTIQQIKQTHEVNVKKGKHKRNNVTSDSDTFCNACDAISKATEREKKK